MPDTLETLLLLELRKFMREEPVAFYDLVRLCRDKSHTSLDTSKVKIYSHGFADLKTQQKLVISGAVISVVRKWVRGRGANLNFNVDWHEEEGQS